jgi:hypothetical protein
VREPRFDLLDVIAKTDPTKSATGTAAEDAASLELLLPRLLPPRPGHDEQFSKKALLPAPS